MSSFANWTSERWLKCTQYVQQHLHWDQSQQALTTVHCAIADQLESLADSLVAQCRAVGAVTSTALESFSLLLRQAVQACQHELAEANLDSFHFYLLLALVLLLILFALRECYSECREKSLIVVGQTADEPNHSNTVRFVLFCFRYFFC
jgi:hypothetical protein